MNLEVLDFTTSILLGGLLAKIYSESDYESPIHNWALHVPNRELMVGDVVYRVGPGRCMHQGAETNCVQITVIDPQGQTTYNIPVELLRTARIQVQGYRI